MIKLVKTYLKCPICGSKENIGKIEKSIPQGDMVYQWVNTHKEKCFLPYNICKNCSLLYVNNYFKEKDLNYLYNQLKNNLYSGSMNAHVKTQLGYQNILNKYFYNNKKPKSIIEFGPDMGILSKIVSETFNPKNYYFVEPNQKLHSNLSIIPNSTILNDETKINNLEDNSIDLIIMVHVFDHIIDPKKVLLSLKSKLKKTGSVFLVTHNTNSFLRYLLRKNWPPFCLHHPQLYNETSMNELFQICGFESTKIFKTYNYFKLSSYVNTALSIIGIKSNLKFGPLIKLPVGNMATLGKK